ncbi:hypothetical protein HPP92_022264 [Vanilla planifolia]|uniref:alpha-L-fucosidase n=1 Tax=Vanilla planifolia TaxID=51239 RepID=A0A835PVD1_VANPL|nr:hypothetical protein HPP92_022264 [Vanilla planifolia]
MARLSNYFAVLLFFPYLSLGSQRGLKTTPPLPIAPLPSAKQLAWQQGEMAMFFHFGMNTFTDSEWGLGRENPSIFSPTALDARQWVASAVAAGFSRVVLTAKHHDGFCLWPSSYTNYSVRSSPWLDGEGDVVAELAAAAKEFGIDLGLYLSPWDRHEPSYGKTLEYNEYYLGQMTELLTLYGDIQEVWLDGAGKTDMVYLFDTWFQLIHQLQPKALIFSEAGPDCRWSGNENGIAGTTCWSLFNKSSAVIGGTETQYSLKGDPYGHDWVAPECDVSIRKGWFWHSSEHPKSPMDLLDIYYKSVGRNCLLILNIPPNSSGLLPDEDLQVLRNFTALQKSIFSHNLAKDALVLASSTRGGPEESQFSPSNVVQEGIYTYWAPDELQTNWTLVLNFGQSVSFNVLQAQEPIQLGQRVIEFHVDVLLEGGWEMIASGTTIGYKRILLFPMVKVQFLRFVIDKSRADPPLVSHLSVYVDPFSAAGNPHGSSRSTFDIFEPSKNTQVSINSLHSSL